MASSTVITAEQYLATHLGDEYPPEFVRGELVYRSIPKWLHSRLQHLLSVRLHQAGLLCAPELHVRVADDVIRIADIAVYREAPEEEIPSSPALIIIEVVSPDDRHQELLRKLEDYRAWGAEHIWVVEPLLAKFHVYRNGNLNEVHAFELSEFGLSVNAAQLFAEATAR
jgi:Uma2 family endonuclease